MRGIITCHWPQAGWGQGNVLLPMKTDHLAQPDVLALIRDGSPCFTPQSFVMGGLRQPSQSLYSTCSYIKYLLFNPVDPFSWGHIYSINLSPTKAFYFHQAVGRISGPLKLSASAGLVSRSVPRTVTHQT